MIIKYQRNKVCNEFYRTLVFFFFIHPFVMKVSLSLSYIIIYGVPLIYLYLNFGCLKNLFITLFKGRTFFLYYLVFFIYINIVVSDGSLYR